MSVNAGVITAWYKPSGASTWTAVVSSGRYDVHERQHRARGHPGLELRVHGFHGGARPCHVRPRLRSLPATTSVNPGGQVTFTATVSPAPASGTVAFRRQRRVDHGVRGTAGQRQRAGDAARSPISTTGHHHVGAVYSGSANGASRGRTQRRNVDCPLVVTPRHADEYEHAAIGVECDAHRGQCCALHGHGDAGAQRRRRCLHRQRERDRRRAHRSSSRRAWLPARSPIRMRARTRSPAHTVAMPPLRDPLRRRRSKSRRPRCRA